MAGEFAGRGAVRDRLKLRAETRTENGSSPDSAQRDADLLSSSRMRLQLRACSSAISARPSASTLNQDQARKRRGSEVSLPDQNEERASAISACRITRQISWRSCSDIASSSSSLTNT